MSRALLLIGCLCLAGCGFQLRGSAALPYESIFVDVPPESEVGAQLNRALRATQAARLAETPASAAAIFKPTGESRERKVLSFSSAGRVREMQLIQRYSFRVQTPAGVDLIEPASLVLARDFSYDDAQTLAKDQEEQLLWRDIMNDMVEQVMRRLAGRLPLPAKSEAAPQDPAGAAAAAVPKR